MKHSYYIKDISNKEYIATRKILIEKIHSYYLYRHLNWNSYVYARFINEEEFKDIKTILSKSLFKKDNDAVRKDFCKISKSKEYGVYETYVQKEDLEKMESNFCHHCAKWKLEYVELKSKSKGKVIVICKSCFTPKIENSLVKCHNYEIIQDIRI